MKDQPNCQDTLAEAAGEYGLTPDDIHDSLNFWMNTEWDHIGSYTVWNTGRPGDYVDLLALMDVLAVPVTCGSGNLWVTSNFSYKPIQVQVFEATRQTAAVAEREWKQNCSLKTQRTLKDFKNHRQSKRSPELEPDPNYKPRLREFPDRMEGDRGRIHQRANSEDSGTYRGTYRRYGRRGRPHVVLPLVSGKPQEARLALVQQASIARVRDANMNPANAATTSRFNPFPARPSRSIAGEVMRIIQVEGEQCVDFNCFNLRDYKERMSVGHMRLQGFRVRKAISQ